MIYYCLPAIFWVKDANHILLINKETGESWKLNGKEALVWDMLIVGHNYQKAIQILAHVLALSEREAESNLQEMLRQWKTAGIIQLRGENTDD